MIDPESFRRDGYVLLRDVLDPAILRSFTQVLERRVDSMSSTLVTRHGLRGDYRDEPFERRLGLLYAGRELDNRDWDPMLFCAELRDLITHPQVTDPLAVLLGEEITYQGNGHVRPYLSRHVERLPWHQDAQFYGAGTEHLLWQMVQVWIPLVDVDADSGCMAVVPGSHRWGMLAGAVSGEDNVVRSSVSKQERIYRDTARRVAYEPITMLPMRQGDLLVFTNLLVHTGTENRSGQVRWSIDVRFEATLGSRPVSELEHHGYQVMRRRLAGRGYVPLRVRGAAGPETWEDWQRTAAAMKAET